MKGTRPRKRRQQGTSHASLREAWRATLARRGAARAVVQAAEARVFSFLDLDAAADAWVATQVPDPAQLAGRAVVFAEPNGPRWFEMFLGLVKVGAVPVPLDPGEPAAVQQRVAEALRAGAWWTGTTLERKTGARVYRDACVIKLTSGSTGQPRPLVFTAGQMLADARQVTATMGVRASDLNHALIPLGHSYGLGSLSIPLLAQGVPLVVGTSALPQAIAADFARWRPTVFPGVPAMWRGLAVSEMRLDSLRVGISAGAPLPPEVAQAFAARFGRRLHGFYGSSETGGITYDRTGRATLAGGVGTALRGVHLAVRRGGRLLVASAAVVTHGNRRRRGALGSWLMAERVKQDERAGIFLAGRLDSIVKIAGRRINLLEVTAQLRRLPGVRDAWVTAVGAGPSLAAVVAGEGSPMELRAGLLPVMASWMIPKKLVVIPALPLTARGKTDTRALRAMVE